MKSYCSNYNNSLSYIQHGDTPLHLAALKNHVEIIRLLVDNYRVPPDLENNVSKI